MSDAGEDDAYDPQWEEPYRGESSGRLRDLLWPVMSWLLAQLSVPLILLVFFVLNRTKIYGRGRVPKRTNTLFLSNHQSMIDSFLITFGTVFPWEVVRPSLLPWHPAAQENFFKNPMFSWLFTQLKCIPVRPGRRDLKAIHRSIRALRNGTMILFPEGTRTRDGSIGPGRPGAGLVALGTGARLVPVTLAGLDEVLPIGARWPRIGKKVVVYIGRPVAYDDLARGPRSREVAQAVVDRVMSRIRFQARVIRRLEGG